MIAFSNFEEKVGVAVGVTSKLIEKYDAVTFVKEAAEDFRWKRWWWKKRFCTSGWH